MIMTSYALTTVMEFTGDDWKGQCDKSVHPFCTLLLYSGFAYHVPSLIHDLLAMAVMYIFNVNTCTNTLPDHVIS